MRGRLALGAMLGGSLAFLVSLYFDWLNAAECFGGRCFASNNDFSVAKDGWSGFGQIAAVLAIALAAGAIAASADQRLAARLPLARTAVALGIFALLSVSELWANAIGDVAWMGHIKIGLGAGAYIGLAGAGVALSGAVAARGGEITWPRRPIAAAGTLITLALLASFVLPALNAPAESVKGFRTGFQGGYSTLICVFACLGLLAWHGRKPGLRLATAAATGTLVAAFLLPLRHAYAYWPYELWLLLACAAGLLVLGLVGSRGLQLRRPKVTELAIVAGSVLLLVSMFLPWRSLCEGRSCFSQNGWSTTQLAGELALGLLLALVWVGRIVRELAIAVVIFVLSAGLVTGTYSVAEHDFFHPSRSASFGFSFHYGAPLGFAGAAVILVVVLGRFRPIPDKRLLVRLVPVLAALALLAFAVAPTFVDFGDLLDSKKLFALQSPFVTLGLLGATAILLTLRLLLRWVDRPGDHAEVVRLPLALLALTVLAVIHDHIVTTTVASVGFTYGKGISWEGWVAIFLCLLLVACGWVARNGAYASAARTDGSASTTSLATSP